MLKMYGFLISILRLYKIYTVSLFFATIISLNSSVLDLNIKVTGADVYDIIFTDVKRSFL